MRFPCIHVNSRMSSCPRWLQLPNTGVIVFKEGNVWFHDRPTFYTDVLKWKNGQKQQFLEISIAHLS